MKHYFHLGPWQDISTYPQSLIIARWSFRVRMGRLDAVISDQLEADFRNEVSRRLGMKKGNLTIAFEDALQMWVETQRGKRKQAAVKAWATRKKLGDNTG